MKDIPLTTEKLKKKFKNNFDMCNFSIQIARNELLSGRHATLGEMLALISIRADDAQDAESSNT